MLTGAAFFLSLSRWLAVSAALPVSPVVLPAIATILLSISAALLSIAPFLLSISTALLSISVGVGMTSAAPEGVLARIESVSVGFC